MFSYPGAPERGETPRGAGAKDRDQQVVYLLPHVARNEWKGEGSTGGRDATRKT